MKTKYLAMAFGLFATASVNAADERTFDWSSQELTSDAGVVATYDRMRAFAADYCKDYLRGTKGVWSISSCRSAVVEEITMKVDHHRLTAYVETGRLTASVASR